jgi:ribosomal-protein-alanine N-acetyltransferase
MNFLDERPMAAWLEPVLADQRVLLRPPAPGDEPALVEMATDERVRHYLGGPADAQTAAVTATQKTAAPSWGQFVIAERGCGEGVGSGSLARKRGPWEISYQVRHQFWGRQLANRPILHQRGARTLGKARTGIVLVRSEPYVTAS